MAYLTYIVDHYQKLPSAIVFLHSHQNGYPRAWHTDMDNYDNVKSLKCLKLDFVDRQGYANLRCNHVPGCPDEVQPFRDPPQDHRDVERLFPDVWRRLFSYTPVPETIGVACCGQFAVSKSQVRARPLEDYIRYRQWVLETNLDDEKSGRVMEYLWHIIFGRDAVQ